MQTKYSVLWHAINQLEKINDTGRYVITTNFSWFSYYCYSKMVGK